MKSFDFIFAEREVRINFENYPLSAVKVQREQIIVKKHRFCHSCYRHSCYHLSCSYTDSACTKGDHGRIITVWNNGQKTYKWASSYISTFRTTNLLSLRTNNVAQTNREMSVGRTFVTHGSDTEKWLS